MSSSSVVQLEDIPTLNEAYKDDEIPPPKIEPFYAHDGALNDRISLYRGDITKLHVGAIVNAANRSLLGGGGVDGAIHRAAGPELLRECRTLHGCETGSAKITKGYNLPAEHVIHAVGPIYDDDEPEKCEDLLQGCYQTSLELCASNTLESVAFSGISTGIYGYPLDDATHIALRTAHNFLTSESGKSIKRVIFTVFRPIDVNSYKKIMPLYFPPEGTTTSAVPEEAVSTAEQTPAEDSKKLAHEDEDEYEPQPMSQVIETKTEVSEDKSQQMSQVTETEEPEDDAQPMSQVEETGTPRP